MISKTLLSIFSPFPTFDFIMLELINQVWKPSRDLLPRMPLSKPWSLNTRHIMSHTNYKISTVLLHSVVCIHPLNLRVRNKRDIPICKFAVYYLLRHSYLIWILISREREKIWGNYESSTIPFSNETILIPNISLQIHFNLSVCLFVCHLSV